MKSFFILLAALPRAAFALDGNAHFQTTVIDQGHLRFHSSYAGLNSQLPGSESATSVTSTLFLGARLRPGTEVYFDPELAGGRGMSSTLGIAGFPNGEVYRVGDPQPTIQTARLFVKQTFDLGGATEDVADAQNQIAGKAAERRVTIVAGRFSLADDFDANAYSHDPRTQFMNWGLMSSLAWDYPADTRGYTWGAMAEYRTPGWAVRAAAAAEPLYANMMQLDRRFGRAHGLVAEGERSFSWRDHAGTARLLVYFNEARMGSYDQTLARAQRTGTIPDVAQTRAYGRTKYGFTSSDDLALSDRLGAFARVSWDDGRNETWAFAEADQSAALGLDWNPRGKDHWGAAQLINGLSGPHRRYLAAGGDGFMLGDGALHYGPELVTETYYKVPLNDMLSVTPDAQLVINPGYNRDRGPIPVWGLRVHAEF